METTYSIQLHSGTWYAHRYYKDGNREGSAIIGESESLTDVVKLIPEEAEKVKETNIEIQYIIKGDN